MRVAWLLALAGCNQIFGLDPVGITDGAPPDDSLDARPPTVQLTFMVAGTTGGAPDPVVTFPPIPDAQIESVRVGRTTAELEPSPYAGGGVDVPPGLTPGAWRLEYKLVGRPPVEIQWSAEPGIGHVAVPLFGRVVPGVAPGASSYQLDASGAGTPATFVRPRAFTTGVWMDLQAVAGAEPLTVGVDTAEPLSGLRGVPTADDLVILAEYDGAGSCQTTTLGTAAFTPQPLEPGAPVTLSTTWTVSANVQTTLSHVTSAQTPRLRLTAALGGRQDQNLLRTIVGTIPHDAMPPFVRELAGVPMPVIVPWADCAVSGDNPTTTPEVFRPAPQLVDFPRAAYTAVIDSRTRDGVALPSSLVAIEIGTSSETAFALDYDVPLATAIHLDTLDLAGGGDDQTLLAGRGELALTFELETVGTADYYEVTLYRLSGGQLIPVRVFVQTDPNQREVLVERSLIGPDLHVFAIRSIRGRPEVSAGDFKAVGPTHAIATVFSRTFKAL